MFRSIVLFLVFFGTVGLFAQSIGTAGTIQGTVVDPSGAVVQSASVTLNNEFMNYSVTSVTDQKGQFYFSNIPPNTYHLIVTTASFALSHQDLTIRSKVPLSVQVKLLLKGNSETVNVKAEAATVDDTVVSHVEIDSGVFTKLPTISVASGLSDIITLGTPGVVADSNGFFHSLGDHAQMSLSVDNQPIADQQGSIYSTQLPTNAIQSVEVIYGITPAEYGDKTSLVANTITRSGLGGPTHGSFTSQYGSFGTGGGDGTLGFGNRKLGNFTAMNVTRSGRFLDTPEYQTYHGIGNSANIFNRSDYRPTNVDTIHLNLFYARNWFQVPNSIDQQTSGQDQRQQVKSFNIAPGWVHIINNTMVLTVNPYVRRDQVGYYPSADSFADQPATIQQNRTLTNFGFKPDLAYVKGRHNAKAGIQISQTNLMEDFHMGVTDPTFNPVCLTSTGDPVLDPTITDPSVCVADGYQQNPNLAVGLVAFDLTRGGSMFHFNQGAHIKEQAAYVEDAITVKQFIFNLGGRFDRYDGMSHAVLWEPRVGISYRIAPSNTVLRLGYSKTLETPLNENLVLSSNTGQGGLAKNVFGAAESVPLQSGRRNQFNAGFEQGIGRLFLLNGDYSWKFTKHAYDLDTLLNTAIIFPIEWRKSKMDGFSIKLGMKETKGVTAFATLGHTRARVFGPETGGLIFNSTNLPSDAVVRIDHDQALQSTTHAQYQLPKRLPWMALTWRYDSGIVASATPDLASLLALTPNQQQTVGFYCGSQKATIANPITSCTLADYGTVFANIPAAGTENDDHNPARIKPRNILDFGVGSDNLFHTDKVRWTARFSVLNLTDKKAMYNFLSTCSGTHFLPPRALRAELGISF
jgi:hypothetical protein